MRINSYKPFVVLSAANPHTTDEANYTAHQDLMSHIKTGFIDAVGITKQWGKERVLILFDPTLPEIIESVGMFGQEAVMLVDQFRNTTMLYITGRSVHLGVWQEISQPEAEAVDHTMVFGKYFKDRKPRYYACK